MGESENNEMNDLPKQIKKGALISYSTLIINTIASLIYIPWMVSIIGKTDYALYTLATTFISIFMIDFGLSSAVSRFVAKYNAEGKSKEINNFVSTIERLYLILGILIFGILVSVYLCLDAIYKGLSIEELETYRELYIIVTVYSLISFPCLPFSGVLNAYEKFIQLKFCELFQKLFSILLTIIVLLNNGNVKGVVLANAISGIAVIIIKFIVIKRSTNVKIGLRVFDRKIAKEVIGFSIWVTVISLAQRCVFNLAPSILGIVSDSEEIAIFSPANALESYFYSFSAAVNGLFLATVSRYVASNKEDQIFELMVKVGRYQFIVMGWIYVGFLCVGEDFMYVWMGEDFIRAWPCALLMFLPDILIFTQQIANTTAIAKNKVKEQSYGYIGMAIICVVLSFLLSKKIGVLGASIAITVSYLFLFIYMNILYQKVLELDMKKFFKLCYGKLIIPILIIAIGGFILCSFIRLQHIWLRILIKTLIISIIYFSLLIPFLENNEKVFIKQILRIKRYN